MQTLKGLLSLTFFAFGAAAALPVAVQAQGTRAAAGATPVVVEALLRDIAMLEQKMIGLAEAIPETSYAWRPAEGVRSVGEVIMHVAADNWFLPTVSDVAAPAATGIKAGDYPSVQAYESRNVSRAEAQQALRESFAHLRAAMQGTNEEFLGRNLELFGMKMTGLDLWVLTTTHLHEHLGQMIAYARSNGIVPPWSRGS